MPDWQRYRKAIVRGSRATELADACARAWSWLDLDPAALADRLRESVPTREAATRMQEATTLVRLRLQRDGASELARRVEATATIDRLVRERFPASTPAQDDRDLAALVAATPALIAAVEATGGDFASPAVIEHLQAAIDAFTPIGATSTGLARHHYTWRLGLAWWAMGMAKIGAKRYAEARDALARAAAMYDEAGEPRSAQDCRNRIGELDARLAADFDGVAGAEVARLLAPQDLAARLTSMTTLLREVARAGDRFEASRLADDAALLLRDNGYPDPETDFDAAVDAWIDKAAATSQGNEVVASVCGIVVHWAAIMAARVSARLATDAKGSLRAERVLRALAPLAAELTREADTAHDDEARRLAVWMPQLDERFAGTDGASDVVRAIADAAALDDALQALRVACNEGASEGLVARADALIEAAKALGSPLHLARAILEKSYVLLALEQATSVPALADEATAILLAGQAPTLSAFANAFERELYLMAITYKARALAAKGDHAAILDVCGAAIREIERERARVSSPYQQSAFLATRVELYEFAVAAAYRAQRWDDVLAYSELLKARIALGRLASASRRDGETSSGLRAIDDALADAVPGSREERDLRARRRWVLTAEAIARTPERAVLPELSLAVVQAALAPDEAAVTWFWIGGETAIVLAIAREGIAHALATPAAADWKAYTETIRALGDDTPRYASLGRRVSSLVEALGPALLPAPIREFVASKSRLALSPHRALHLFPLHAVRWDGRYAIEAFSIRYVPSLASLLVPVQAERAGPVLCAGVSHFDDIEIPALAGAADEARAVAAVHSTQALLDPSRAQFTSQPLSTYRCLHLATHGSSVLTGDAIDDPMQACLHFRDDVLDGWQIAQLPLRAELVVLAACNSGQRAIAGRGLDALPGDELFGLLGAFFDAGAAAVLGALWPVESRTSLPLLVDFHRAYARGVAPEDALRDAVRTHLASSDRSHDVFSWAPFFTSALGRRCAS